MIENPHRKEDVTAEDIEDLRWGFAAAVYKEGWDKWYLTLPEDLKRRLSIHDFKRLGESFRKAFGIDE